MKTTHRTLFFYLIPIFTAFLFLGCLGMFSGNNAKTLTAGELSPSEASDQQAQITQEQLALVNGQKLKDDPTFETTIWSAVKDDEAGTFTLIFSHNSTAVQPVWLEEFGEKLDYTLDKTNLAPGENATLIVYYTGALPRFRLHVGSAS